MNQPEKREDSDPDGMSAGRSVTTSAGLLFLTQIAGAVVNLPVSILLARVLGPEDLGHYQFIYRGALIAVSVACYGYPHALAWAAQKSGIQAAAVWAASIRTAVIAGIALGLVALGLNFLVGFHPGGQFAWILISAFPLFNLLSANLVNFARGKLDIKQIATIRLSQAFSWVLLVIAFQLFGILNLDTAIIAMVVSQAVGAILGVSAGIKYRNTWRAVLRPVPNQIRTYARHAFIGIAVRDLNVYVDQMIIALFLGPAELGLYAVAVSLTASLGLLSAPITNTVQPIIQRMADTERRNAAPFALAGTLVVLGVPGGLLALLAPPLVPLVYGDAYTGSVVLVQILSVAAVIDGLNSCSHGILLGIGKPLQGSVSAGVGLIATAVMLFTLMPLIGLTGAALASAGAYAVVLMFMLRAIAKNLEIGTTQLLIGVCSAVPKVLSMAWTKRGLLRKRLLRRSNRT